MAILNSSQDGDMTQWLLGKAAYSPSEYAFGQIGSQAVPVPFSGSNSSAFSQPVAPIIQPQQSIPSTPMPRAPSTPVSTYASWMTPQDRTNMDAYNAGLISRPPTPPATVNFNPPPAPTQALAMTAPQVQQVQPAAPAFDLQAIIDQVKASMPAAPTVDTPNYAPTVQQAVDTTGIDALMKSIQTELSGLQGNYTPQGDPTTAGTSAGNTAGIDPTGAVVAPAGMGAGAANSFQVPPEIQALITKLQNDNTYQTALTGGTELLNQYTKGAAFTDAAALMQQRAIAEREANMPAIQRAVEGSGTSASSMQALLSQRAARDTALSSASLGAEQAKAYGQIQSNIAGTLGNLVAQGNPNLDIVAQLQNEIMRQGAENQRLQTSTEANRMNTLTGALESLASGKFSTTQQALSNAASTNANLYSSYTGAQTQANIANQNLQGNILESVLGAQTSSQNNAANNQAQLAQAQLQANTAIQTAGMQAASDWAKGVLNSQTAIQTAGMDADSRMALAILDAENKFQLQQSGNQSDWDRAVLAAQTQNYATDTNRQNAILAANTQRATSGGGGGGNTATYIPKAEAPAAAPNASWANGAGWAQGVALANAPKAPAGTAGTPSRYA